MKSYELILTDLLDHSYIETFEDVFEPEYFMYLEENSYEELIKGNITDLRSLNYNLNYIKHYLTKNKFFYSTKQWSIFKSAKLLVPYITNSIQMNGDEATSKIKKKDKFSQVQFDNKIAAYLRFLTIVSDLNLFLVIDPYDQTYTVIEDIDLHKYVPLYFLCINLWNGFRGLTNDNSIKLIESIKSKYSNLWRTQMVKVFQDIQEAINTKASFKIKLDINKGDINYLDAKFRDQDLSKINEYKWFMNDGNVTSSTTIEEYNWKPTAITGYRRKRYKQ